MIEVYDKDTKGSKPYRVRIDGATLKNKKGEPRRFATMLEAISAAQRASSKGDKQ